jgi:hypothetical protein
VVEIEPTREYPTPYDLSDEVPASFLEEMAVAGNTAEAQQALGAEYPQPAAIYDMARYELLQKALKSRNPTQLQTPAVALATAEFLRTYGSQLAIDVTAMRIALTNKLIKLADCGEPRYELKAIEMLGKHSDIGLFTDRSEITINYKDPESLEAAIKERVKRLLNADIIDITPTTPHQLDEELGVFDIEAAKAARINKLTPEEGIQLQAEKAEERKAKAQAAEALHPLVPPPSKNKRSKVPDPGQPKGARILTMDDEDE